MVDLVSEQVALKRAGRDFVGLCPFHQEKTPSFSVSPAKQIFKCFGCGAGGDVFTFIQLREGVSFVEALRILADRAGIDYDRHVGRAPADGIGRADLARVNAWAMEVFRRALTDGELGQVPRAYAAKRGISPEMIAAFGLGWAPEEGSWLLARARGSNVRMDLLHAAGLAARGGYGDDYGVFRGRLMFPIRDTMNRVIGFGGRTLIDDRAKYLNTAQNALFDKGRNVYGIDRAREAMAATRQVVVVEGYTDCIACHQHGITNVVATLGTALTDDQVGLLRRWCDEVVLVFDSDNAGQNAADRALGVALRHNLTVRIAQVSSGKDPADFLADHGADDFRELLKSAEDALGFKWRRTCDRFEQGSGGGRKEAIREFVQLVAGTSRFRGVDAIQQGLIVNQLAKLLALPGREVHQLLADAARTAERPRSSEMAGAGGPVDASLTSAEADVAEARRDALQAGLVALVQVVLNEPGLYGDVAEVLRPELIADGRTRRIAEAAVELAAAYGEFALSELLARFEDPQDMRRVTELVFRGAEIGNFSATAADTAERLRMLIGLGAVEAAAQRRQSMAGGPPAAAAEDAARQAEDAWLRSVQQTRAQARGFAPRIPLSMRTTKPPQ